jgi:hypothetical protein
MLVMSLVMALKEQLREMVFFTERHIVPCALDNFDWKIFLQALVLMPMIVLEIVK